MGARLFLQSWQRPLQRLHVGEDQLRLDHLDIGLRVDAAVDVRHVVVGEHPHHLADRIALADVGQELVAKARALGGAFDNPGDINERDRRMDDLFRVKHLRELRESRIGQGDDPLVRLDRRERVIRRQHVVPRQRIEQRRLADVGQSDDSQIQAHRVQSLGDSGGHASSELTASLSNSRYGLHVSAQRARSAVTADHRSAHPNIPGVPWWGAVLIAATLMAVGFAYDAGSGAKELTAVFAGTYVVGCILAVLAVRQAGIFTAVIQPPLLLFGAVPTAYFVFTGSQLTNFKDTLINCAYPLIERFPLMFFTSAIVLLIGMARWYPGMSARRGTPSATSRGRAEWRRTRIGGDVQGFRSAGGPRRGRPRR